jgi:8-oxo-dGTP diphosphatase
MVEVAAGLILQSSSILVCQRKRTARYPLQWEFPGGKLESGETVSECLHRELCEELGIDAVIGREFHRHEWLYQDSGSFAVYFHFVDSFPGTPVNNVFEEIRWIPLYELAGIDMLEGNREVVERLARLL